MRYMIEKTHMVGGLEKARQKERDTLCLFADR